MEKTLLDGGNTLILCFENFNCLLLAFFWVHQKLQLWLNILTTKWYIFVQNKVALIITRRKCPSRTCSGNASNVSFEISFKEVNDSKSAAWDTLDAALNRYYLIIVLKFPQAVWISKYLLKTTHDSFSQNYHQLTKVPLIQPEIGIIW